jgi:hypothetical protein
VEWRSSETRPAFVPGTLFQIEPNGVPYIKLADIRTTGNLSYGEKCDHEWGHIHPPVHAAVVREGANAFINNAAQRFPHDNVEVMVTAVLAHAGLVPRAIRERHFPEGRALLVARVFPGSAAEAAGMHAADLLAMDGGVALRAGRGYELESIPVVENETTEMVVIRDGQEVRLSLVRRGRSKFGFNWGEVPILEDTP